MSHPRHVRPGRTSMITRRCADQRAFLRPTRDGEVNDIVLWCQALAARDTGVDPHAICAMPNHTHDVSTDVLGLRPLYCQQLNSNVARALNVCLERSDAVWSSTRSYSRVDLESAEAVLKEVIYTITNPIRAGLVGRIEDYPGLVTRPEMIGVPTVVKRPKRFFRQPGDDAAEIARGGPRTARDRARHHARLASSVKGPKEPFPDELTITFTKPPQFAHLTIEQYRKLVRDGVNEETERVHAARLAAGGRPCLGAEGIFAMRPDLRPGDQPGAVPRPAPPTGGLDPRFAAPGASELRQAMAQHLIAFWKAHRRARERFRDGEREVAFPCGTWAAVHIYGADVELFDP